jgi:uncharacterized membrane protein YjjP (DUF1212 family)
MPENREIYKTLDLALRVGEVLLSSGAGAADVTATMWSVVHACGLRGVDIDVTFTVLTMSHQASYDEPALIQVRHVRHRDIDYEDLTLVDHIVRDLIRGDIDRDEARSRLAKVVSSGHRLPRWAATLGYGLMGGGVGMLLGGDVLVIAIAFLSAVAIDVLMRAMSRRRLPSFYQQVAGGLLATLIAVGAAASNLDVDPSFVVTVGIIMLLAGIGFMGGRMLGVNLGRLDPGVTSLSEAGTVVLGAAICAAAFAFACYSPPRALAPIAAVAGGAALVSVVMEGSGFGRAWSAATAAVLIGLVSYSLAAWVRVPPLVIVVSAIVPLLPGLSIYRGLSLMAAGGNGILSLVGAAAIAIALASGVILGEYAAQPLHREARRLEVRLAGPRLVGPLRARSVKKRRSATAG